MRYPLPWFPLLDDPSQCSCRYSGRNRDGRFLAVFIVEDGQTAGFVVDVIEYATSLVGTLNQVAGFVVGVAAVEYGTTKVV